MIADSPLLETIYYSAPIPRNAHVFTMLGVIFDKVHFPGVYLPRGGYDPNELAMEILRLEQLDDDRYETKLLIGMLKCLNTLPELETFCEFEASPDAARRREFDPNYSVDEIYDAIHGPRPEGWQPIFDTTVFKGLPGSEEEVIYPGTYHYLGGTIMKSSATGIPLVNDDKSLELPGMRAVSPKGDISALTTMLAIHSARVVLPEVCAMTPGQLVDFRAQNEKNLHAFRRSMLKYVAKLDSMIKDGDTHHIAERTEFFVATEIRPALEELRADIKKSNRPWSVRAADAAAVGGAIAAGFLSSGTAGAAVGGLVKLADAASKELQAARDVRDRHEKNGLYYLLEVERFVR
ncbi:hypothetical protein [Methylocystis hirsuta]|nr:hypothetical protein [Methylocystis hirsuta]